MPLFLLVLLSEMNTMKHLILLHLSFYLLLFCFTSNAQSVNMAASLDGIDNVMSIGSKIIEPPFTLEMWYKPDDSEFKEMEVLVGGKGLHSVDIFPLTLEKGVLSNKAAGLSSGVVSTPEWHHAALICDGSSTMLYYDGEMVAKKDTVISILPCDIGYQYNGKKKTLFAGEVDEFRIWSEAIPGKILRNWKGKDVTPKHPYFEDLAVYFNFDSELIDHAVNPAGTGHQPYHLRNGRIDVYNETLPIACSVPSENPSFKSRCSEKQKLFNAVVVESEWDTERGAKQDQILKLRVFVSGSARPLKIKSLQLEARDVNLENITKLQIWDAGQTPRCKEKKLLCTIDNLRKSFNVTLPGKGLELKSGVNYILLTADISEEAEIGDFIRFSVPSFKLGLRKVKPLTTDETLPKEIIVKSGQGILNVVQWNIYQGGKHVGNDGVARVTDLLKASGADLITMQEGYGSQKSISEALGMNMLTREENANLALLSRYPISALPTSDSFKSNPAFVTLPDDNRIFVDDLWIRYTSNPAYTENYIDPGQNTGEWIEGDKHLGLVDITAIINNDTLPYVTDDSDIILSGDFNSGSHLDWTDPCLHYGYGNLKLPISIYMSEQGFQDSFREINPDEVKRSEGTWAVTFGHLQRNRIDYIYYKGPHLKAIHSKIIRTAPEIDDVWASDHAAMNTIFSY